MCPISCAITPIKALGLWIYFNNPEVKTNLLLSITYALGISFRTNKGVISFFLSGLISEIISEMKVSIS